MTRVAVLVVAVLASLARVGAAAPLKGDGPTALAVGHGAVWIGMGDGTLLRIDPGSGRSVQRLLRDRVSQYGYVHELAIGFGSVWVAQGSYDTLRRLDPRTGRSIEIRPRGRWTATLVAVGAGAVWVGDFERNTVFRVDPRTNRVIARIAAPGLSGLAAGPAGAWVILVPRGRSVNGPREVRRIDVRANRLAERALHVDCYEVGVAVGSKAAWLTDACGGTLRRLEARTGQAGPALAVGRWPTRPAMGAGSVWLVDQVAGEVVRVEPGTGRVVARIRVRAFELAPGDPVVWVLDQGDGRVGYLRRIDAATNRVVGDAIRLAPG